MEKTEMKPRLPLNKAFLKENILRAEALSTLVFGIKIGIPIVSDEPVASNKTK